MQLFTRSPIVPTRPERDRYCGKRAYTPTQGIAPARRPSYRWQLVQRRSFPTWPGSESPGALRIARPRMTESESGSDLSDESGGAGSSAVADCVAAGGVAGAPQAAAVRSAHASALSRAARD